MAKENEYLIETDIILEHLTWNKIGLSTLEVLMQNGVCYSTVFTASEIYFYVQNETEKKVVDGVFMALKVLGLNGRYGLFVDEFSGKVKTVRDALQCVASKLNRLPIVTFDVERFENAGINIINPKVLRGSSDIR